MKRINYGLDDNSLFGTDEDDIRPSIPKSNRDNGAVVKTGAKRKAA